MNTPHSVSYTFEMAKLLEEYLKQIEEEKEKKRRGCLRRTLRTLEGLSREFSFKKAYIFGSILKKKKFYYDSDIDIAIAGLSNKDFFRFMARLSDRLGRDVEVLQMENHPFRAKIIKEGLLWKRRN